jgi:hypothetical protein
MQQQEKTERQEQKSVGRRIVLRVGNGLELRGWSTGNIAARSGGREEGNSK